MIEKYCVFTINRKYYNRVEQRFFHNRENNMEDKERHSLEGMNVMHRIVICYIQNS